VGSAVENHSVSYTGSVTTDQGSVSAWQQFNVHEAKSNLSKLLDMALEGEDVIILRHRTPVARLSPIRAETGDRVLGAGRGSVNILNDDWNKPMTDDDADAFWAGRW
jgi:antitoxin (DNA-binding transcriptional repressor) of toxin-antitoxin stability system